MPRRRTKRCARCYATTLLRFNPFYALPPGGGGFFGFLEKALAMLPVSGVGLTIGLAAAFLFPLTSVPGVTEEVLVGLILGMSLLHAIAFAGAIFGVFSILTWPRRLWFSVTFLGWAGTRREWCRICAPRLRISRPLPSPHRASSRNERSSLRTAVARWPAARITLRQGIRVVRDTG